MWIHLARESQQQRHQVCGGCTYVCTCVKHLEIYPQNTEINNYQNFREKWINQPLEILTHPTRRLIECIKIIKFIDIEGIKIQ